MSGRQIFESNPRDAVFELNQETNATRGPKHKSRRSKRQPKAIAPKEAGSLYKYKEKEHHTEEARSGIVKPKVERAIKEVTPKTQEYHQRLKEMEERRKKEQGADLDGARVRRRPMGKIGGPSFARKKGMSKEEKARRARMARMAKNARVQVDVAKRDMSSFEGQLEAKTWKCNLCEEENDRRLVMCRKCKHPYMVKISQDLKDGSKPDTGTSDEV